MNDTHSRVPAGEPINRLNPTKCPFCGPSTLSCGWGGHKTTSPANGELATRLRFSDDTDEMFAEGH